MQISTRLLVLTAVIGSGSVAAEECTPRQLEKGVCSQTKYHAQDVRNVDTKLFASYYNNSGDTLTLGGQYGVNGVAAVGASFRDWSSDSTLNIHGQYNINPNVVVKGSYDLNSGNTFILGGKYVMPVELGVIDVGGNYLNSDWDSTLEFEAGLLVPIDLFYYRGDIGYQFDWNEEFRFGNKFGWNNGQFDANVSLTYSDYKHGDDTYLGFEFGYFF